MPYKLLKLEEVAERTGLSVRTIRGWASRRYLPVCKVGRRTLVPESELDRWLTARLCEVRDPATEARRRRG